MSPLSRARASYRRPRAAAERKSVSFVARFWVHAAIEWSIWARLPGAFTTGASGAVTGPFTVTGVTGCGAGGPAGRMRAPTWVAATRAAAATRNAIGLGRLTRGKEMAVTSVGSGRSIVGGDGGSEAESGSAAQAALPVPDLTQCGTPRYGKLDR